MPGSDLALLVLILAGGAFVQGLSGFGFALVTVPVASVVIPPAQAVVVVSLASALTSIRNAAAARGHVDRNVATRMTAAAFVGMPLGLLVLDTVDDQALRLVIGAVVAVTAVLIAAGIQLRAGTPRTDVVTGFLSGVLNTSTSTNGPPLVIGLRAHRLGIAGFRGTMAVVFLASSAVGITLFAASGRIGGPELTAAAVSLPGQLVAALAGDRAGRRLGDHRFDRLVVGLLFVSAVAAVAAALAS